MTAAVNGNPAAPTHPPGGSGIAAPHTAVRGTATLPTPASPAPSPFSAPVIPSVTERLERHSLIKGEFLYRSGQPARYAFFIEAGLVALTLEAVADRDRVVALAGPGDVLGAIAPNLIHYPDSAVALSTDVTVRLVVSPSAQAQLELGDSEAPCPELEALLLRAAGEQIVRLTHALEDSAYPVPARVARTFLRLGERFGHNTEEGAVRLTLPLTHDTLAALVGAARETTTGVVQQLRADGLLEGTRGRYRYRPEALRDYAHAAALAPR